MVLLCAFLSNKMVVFINLDAIAGFYFNQQGSRIINLGAMIGAFFNNENGADADYKILAFINLHYFG